MAIGIDVTDPTSIGTGTTKTQLNDGNSVVLPSDARSILAIIPLIEVATSTPDESVIAKVIIESNDNPVTPLEILLPPISGGDADHAGNLIPTPIKIPVNIPVVPGSRIDVYGQALVANTVAPLMGCGLVIGTAPPTGQQIHAQVSDLTATGTTVDVDVSGGTLSITSGSRLKELYGVVVPGTLAAADGILGYLKYISSGLTPPLPLKVPFTPFKAGLAANASTLCDAPLRCPVDVAIKVPATINVYAHFADLPAAAGNFATCAMYV